MPLRMKSLRIQGFKAIGDATLYWHPRVNVITGPNNSGKTTVLEALALWVEGFDRMCVQAGRAITKRGVRQGDWYVDWAHAHHSEVVSVRSPGVDDLFHRDAGQLTLTATLSDDTGDLEIPIHIRKLPGGNYEFTCSAIPNVLNPRLNASCKSWPRPFRVLFASPVAAVLSSEEFLMPGKTAAMIQERRSGEVMRNRIHRLHSRANNEFERFNDDVSRVLTGGTQDIRIEVQGDPNTWVHARVLARSTPRDRPRDISLLGSGSLQVIEILLDLYLSPSDLDIVLLDEPDSHIHRDVQRRLLEVIEDRAQQAQVFATTHNESLLRNAGWDRVFHLAPSSVENPREFRPIGSEQLVATGRQHGLMASPLRNVLSSVGAETALDFLNALESQHFLLVEGGADAVLIDRMFAVARFGTPRETAMYWSLGGLDSGLRSVAALRAVLGNVRNDRSLWDKARLVLDRDLLTDSQAEAIVVALRDEFELDTRFWAARTAEAVLLSGGPSLALANLLRRVGTASRLAGVTESDEVAVEACRQAWTSLGERLQTSWGQPQYEYLGGVLSQRAKLLDAVLRAHRPLSSDVTKLQSEVSTFHLRAIEAGRYHESASKQEVAAFVCETLQHMGVAPDAAEAWRNGPSWLTAVVSELGSVREFPALHTMLEWLRRSS